MLVHFQGHETMDDPETGWRVWLKISSAKDWESNPNRRLSEVLSVTGMPKGTYMAKPSKI